MFRTGLRSAGSSVARLGIGMGAFGLAAVLVMGGCSASGDDPGAEAAEGSYNSAPPSSPNGAAITESASASGTSRSSPTSAAAGEYKPATAEGPAENVPLPVMPELAKQESSEGLREFARYWYALLNYSFETGSADSLKQVSGPDCVLCKRAYEMLDIGYENEDWILGGKFIVHGTQSNYVLTSESQYQVLVHVEQDALEYRGPEAKVYERDDGLSSDTVHMLEATYADGGWFAHNVVTVRR